MTAYSDTLRASLAATERKAGARWDGEQFVPWEKVMTETKRGGTGMREALEITRMQLAVNMAGKNALSNEKHLSIVNAALSPTGDERREAIEECAKVADVMAFHSSGAFKDAASGLARRIRSLLHADGGEKP